MIVREEKLDLVLVPLALAALACYHLWLLYTILRAFYVAMAPFLWTFGPIPMLVCTVLMCGMLYFLDTTPEHAHVHWHAAGAHGHSHGGGNGTV